MRFGVVFHVLARCWLRAQGERQTNDFSDSFSLHPMSGHVHLELDNSTTFRRETGSRLARENATTSQLDWLLAYIETSLRVNLDPEPVPYSEHKSSIEACRCKVLCNTTRLGVGRRGIGSQWITITLAPFGVAFLVITGTSVEQPRNGKLNIQSYRLFVALMVILVISFMTGHFSYNILARDTSDWCILAITFALWILLACVIFRSADVEFSMPRFSDSVYFQGLGIFRLIVLKISQISLCYVREHYLNTGLIGTLANDICAAYNIFGMALLPRNISGVLYFIHYFALYSASFFFWEDTTGLVINADRTTFFPVVVIEILTVLLVFAAPYSRDRYFIAFSGMVMSRALKLGQSNCNVLVVLEKEYLRIALAILLCFACIVALQYQIILPERLRLVKFVRLSCLYKLRDDGRLITRCQDLPQYFFGNPCKAVHMIIISHHWLDKDTCDSATHDYPGGLRLTTMCERLEYFFPWTWPGFSAFQRQPVTTYWNSLTSSAYCLDDIVVFFDYMCLPQNGKTPDGVLVERTPDEQQIFKSSLPAVGLLYTMFPVMVCPEVAEWNEPYFTSGWCFSEWQQSDLCGTLSPYSIDTGGGVTEHLDNFEHELKTKLFRSEGDRDVVRGIVQGTRIRRELRDAVQSEDAERVQAALRQLTEYSLKDTINFPVDPETLDSLLHVAMKQSSKQIATSLVEYGADPRCHNHRGEEPGQFLLFPRSWFPCL